MTDFRPIPIPFRQRWRQFRAQGLPVLVFLVAVVAMVFLWDRKVAPPSLAGEVYASHGAVYAPASGIIEEFDVAPFQEVRAGQQLGIVRRVPARQAELALAALRAEIELIRLGGGDPVLNQQRNLLDWQSLRRDWLLARTDLATIRARISQAELSYRRFERLAESEAGSLADLELAKAEYETLVAQETETAELAARLEEAVRDSSIEAAAGGVALDRGMEAALRWKEAQLEALEAEMEPRPILAPFSGRVMPPGDPTVLYRRNQDFVREGELIFEMRASEPEFIVGYLRQPSSVVPTEGMPIQVATRGGRPVVAEARILQVGSQFQALGPAFQRPIQLVEERALPLLISLPDGLLLRPGEIVDLRLSTSDAAGSGRAGDG